MNIILEVVFFPNYDLIDYITLEAPECDCGAAPGSMMFICETDSPNCPTQYRDDADDDEWPGEVWRCSVCGAMERYDDYEYGEREIHYTPQELADKQAPKRQSYWLNKRYKTDNPESIGSIKDYWQ